MPGGIGEPAKLAYSQANLEEYSLEGNYRAITSATIQHAKRSNAFQTD